MSLSPAEQWRYAFSAFKLNRCMAMTNAVAVMIAVVHVIVPCYYGHALYLRQSQIMGESRLNLIVASAPADRPSASPSSSPSGSPNASPSASPSASPNNGPTTGWFDRRAIAAWNQRSEVALAFPKIAQNVKLWPGRLATPTPWLATMEATVPADPGIRSDRLAWGIGPASTRELSAVISRSLLRRLGGELGDFGPTITQVTLGANRTRGGRPEQMTVTLRIAGILDEERAIDTVFVPLDVVERIDRWCLHRIATFGVHVGHVPVGNEAEALDRQALDFPGPVVASLPNGFRFELHAAREHSTARYAARHAAAERNGAVRIPSLVAAASATASAATSGHGRIPRVVHATPLAGWDLVVSPEAAECHQLTIGDPFPFILTSSRGETRTFTGYVARIEHSPAEFSLSGSVHADLARWANGWAAFDPADGGFLSLTELHSRQGYSRCNIYARGPAEVRRLVDWLEAHGYRTENQLAAQESLEAMAQAISVVVGMISAGCLMLAMTTVILSSSMSAQSRAHEMGILQALGLSRQTITAIFAKQGVTIGLIAFAAAAAAVAIGEPLLRRLASRVMPIEELVEGQIYSIEYWWIHALALAIAVLTCVIGTTMPAWRLTRRRVTELLRLNT